MKKVIIIAFSFFLTTICWSNQDSLWSIYNNPEAEAAVKAVALNELAWSIMFTDTDSAFNIGELMLIEAKKSEREDLIVSAYNDLGVASSVKGNFRDALKHYDLAMEILIDISDVRRQASNYSNIGIAYSEMGDDRKALSNYLQSLKLLEAIFDTIAVEEKDGIEVKMASCNTNIGLIYENLDEFKMAQDCYDYSLATYRKLNIKRREANVLSNSAELNFQMEQYVEAKSFHEQALEIRIEIEDIYGQARSHQGLGELMRILKNNEEAKTHFTKSLELFDNVGDAIGASKAKLGMVLLLIDEKEYSKALSLCKDVYNISKEAEALNIRSEICECFHICYKELGQSDKALMFYEEHVLLRDSLKSEERVKDIYKQTYQFEYEKQKAIDEAQHEKEIAIEQEEKEKQQILSIAIGIGLFLVVVFLIFVFNRLRVTRKQKNVIEEQKGQVEKQKEIIEEAHDEITDSIRYAKRLQDAILPSFKEVTKHLPNSFILFIPKGVVSGDFYWFEHIDECTYIAAADCTGHGVPGAMVSMVCSTALNRSVKEFGLTEPSKILDKTRELVIETFVKSEDDVKDGMDIALCAINRKKVIYSGANNPLWIVRETELLTETQKQERSTVIEDNLSLIEFKGNKQPIGLHDDMRSFAQSEIELNSGDCLYFFTDGFADQFGGKKGKKFMYKPFKKLLLDIQTKAMPEQEEIITQTFEEWRGSLEQIDDVCIIGVKIG